MAKDEKATEYNLLFVGGDLSGIQKFLYNISSRKASVSLKGRSAYLSMYMKRVCERIQDACLSKGGTATRVIYDSGGKFYVVTNNTPEIQEAIRSIIKEEQTLLWKEHKGLLALNLGLTPFVENEDGTVSVEGADRVKIGVLWERVNGQFANQKNQKFKSLILNGYEDFFGVTKVGASPIICAVSGIEMDKCNDYIEYHDAMIPVSPSVKKQIEIGEDLRNKQGFLTFKEYANGSYLGILRMDVDGLGARFVKGFDSFQQYEAFSNGLCNYFENELNQKWNTPEYKNYLNIIYAGGDDLFIVGHWNKVICFAHSIHEDIEQKFAKESIHISGGVAIVHEKYPIAKAAMLAGDAEDNAKSFRDGEKNAFCMFNRTISWDAEFDYVKRMKEDFVEKINDGLPRGILHKMMLYASIVHRNQDRVKDGKDKDYSYVWHSAYYLTRAMERNKGNMNARDFCRKLRDQELTKGERTFELVALAARWAEYELMDNNKNTNKQ